MTDRGRHRLKGLAVVVGLVVAVAGTTAAATHGRAALRDMDVLRVERVEVVGTRYLEPYTVVRAAGLDRGASLLDDADAWRAGVRTLALVEEVWVQRRPPATVIVRVTETQPVALVAAETLRPVDASGRLLELEPAGVVLDLPVLVGLEVRGGAVAAGPSAEAVATVAALLQRAPELAERVAHARLRGDGLHLSLRNGRTTAVVPAGATDVQLMQLHLTAADLTSRGEMEKVRLIDVRFRDQVVVSFLDRPVS